MSDSSVPTLTFRHGVLELLDQTRLPMVIEILECRDARTVAAAIARLSVRGAPAIGLAGAYGVVLQAQNSLDESPGQFRREVESAAMELRATRPTAVNLAWGIDRMLTVLRAATVSNKVMLERLLAEANRMMVEDDAANRAMGQAGAKLIPDGANVLTHCNAGALATGSFGTALGVIRAAHELGKQLHVWVDETRPLLQGARLTTWELQQLGIAHTLITDNMAAHFMALGKIDLAIVGADRIVANGDVANKIGTYGVAVLAHAHGLPLYVAAPTSTVDLSLPSGDYITIEERQPEEVTQFRSEHTATRGTSVANPAFDVTPARLIAAIVTERGVIRTPFEQGLRHHVEDARASMVAGK